jgi:hypothetical protein
MGFAPSWPSCVRGREAKVQARRKPNGAAEAKPDVAALIA